MDNSDSVQDKHIIPEQKTNDKASNPIDTNDKNFTKFISNLIIDEEELYNKELRDKPDDDEMFEGCASFVRFRHGCAYKIISYTDLYLIRELNCLYLIKANKHPSFVYYKKISYTNKLCIIKFKNMNNGLFSKVLRTDKDILQCLLDVSCGLKFLHHNKIIHRDIKPSNILIDESDSAHIRFKIIDFSHSIEKKHGCYLDEYVCTYTLRPPEVYRYAHGITKSYDYEIDLWSLGVVLFDLVCKRISIFHNIKEEIVYEHLKDHNAYENKFLPRLEQQYALHSNNEELKHIDIYLSWIRLLLSEDPENRPSASEFYDIVWRFAYGKYDVLPTIYNDKFEILCNASIDFTNIMLSINRNILNRACETAYILNRIAPVFTIRVEILRPIFILMIHRGILVHMNLMPMVFALRAILSMFIYDYGVCSVETSIEEASSYYNNTVLTTHNVSKSIRIILKNFAKDIFLYDIFGLKNNTLTRTSS